MIGMVSVWMREGLISHEWLSHFFFGLFFTDDIVCFLMDVGFSVSFGLA